MNKRILLLLLIFLNLAALFIGAAFLLNDPLFLGMRAMASAFQIVDEHFVDPLDPQDLFYASLSGIKAGLDPFTGYFPPRVYQYYEEESQGEFYGIGVEITVRDGLLTVISPIAGTPAEEVGLRAGDRVTMIGNVDASTLDPDEAIDLIRGEPGTVVELRISRPGIKDEFSVKITRAVIKLSSIDYAGIIDSLGYIRLTRFALTSYVELAATLDSLKAVGMKGLVLDLRGNPGGFLEVAVAITGLFLPADVLVVSTAGRGFTEDFDIRNFMDGEYREIPMVVLVDGGSASASEILAGALQDYDRAVLLGDTTFGKGLVQNVSRLSEGGALRMTVSKYYLPSGRIIQKFSDEERSKNVTYSRQQVDSIYTTTGGRRVFGGGGVVPDLIMAEEIPDIFQALLAYGGHYFDFAVEYLQSKKDNFSLPLDESVLDEFRAYLLLRGVAPTNRLEESFNEFVDRALEESASFKSSKVIAKINMIIEETSEDYWEKNKSGILKNLSRAMARQVYSKPEFYRRYEFDYDPRIRFAFELLKDSSRYNKILKGGQ